MSAKAVLMLVHSTGGPRRSESRAVATTPLSACHFKAWHRPLVVGHVLCWNRILPCFAPHMTCNYKAKGLLALICPVPK